MYKITIQDRLFYFSTAAVLALGEVIVRDDVQQIKQVYNRNTEKFEDTIAPAKQALVHESRIIWSDNV